MELDIRTTDRLLNAILFCLGPSLEDESIREKPWLNELAESYNEIVDKVPVEWKLLHHQLLQF
ncbi:hypothetical protein MASR2M47_41150 [Draconibacterium sp.]